MTYKRKTKDIWEIQSYYGIEYGWEVTNTELTYKDAKRSVKEYRENEPMYSHRIVKRREKIEQEIK